MPCAELVSTLYFMLGNEEDAQDAAQDAFLKCWRSMDSLADVQNLKAWIFRVGLNAAKDLQKNAWRRRAKQWTEGMPEAEEKALAPDEVIVEKEAVDQLRAAVMELRDDEQAVFLLRRTET